LTFILSRHSTPELQHDGESSDDSDAEMDDVQEDEWEKDAEAEELYH
jgi:hypothetical protein